MNWVTRGWQELQTATSNDPFVALVCVMLMFVRIDNSSSHRGSWETTVVVAWATVIALAYYTSKTSETTGGRGVESPANVGPDRNRLHQHRYEGHGREHVRHPEQVKYMELMRERSEAHWPAVKKGREQQQSHISAAYEEGNAWVGDGPGHMLEPTAWLRQVVYR